MLLSCVLHCCHSMLLSNCALVQSLHNATAQCDGTMVAEQCIGTMVSNLTFSDVAIFNGLYAISLATTELFRRSIFPTNDEFGSQLRQMILRLDTPGAGASCLTVSSTCDWLALSSTCHRLAVSSTCHRLAVSSTCHRLKHKLSICYTPNEARKLSLSV